MHSKVRLSCISVFFYHCKFYSFDCCEDIYRLNVIERTKRQSSHPSLLNFHTRKQRTKQRKVTNGEHVWLSACSGLNETHWLLRK